MSPFILKRISQQRASFLSHESARRRAHSLDFVISAQLDWIGVLVCLRGAHHPTGCPRRWPSCVIILDPSDSAIVDHVSKVLGHTDVIRLYHKPKLKGQIQ